MREPLLVLLNLNVSHYRFFGCKCRDGSVLIIMVEGVMRSLFNEGDTKSGQALNIPDGIF